MSESGSDGELQELKAYKSLFDRIERQPLTHEQRTACVSSARNTLVLAGAGTGKTSTLAGRAAYLQASGKARPEQILLLAFAREAAHEMDSRIASRQKQGGGTVQARTFHALGLSIVREVEQTSIALSELNDDTCLQAYLDREFFQLLNGSARYGHLVLSWFDAYETQPRFRSCFKAEKKYRAYLEQHVFRSYNDDYTRNVSEMLFANALAVLGIAYVYRAHYFRDIYLRAYEPYCCCFYLSTYDCYVEIHDLPESWVMHDPLVEKYRTRVREIHCQHGTFLLEFYEQKIDASGINPFVGMIQQALGLGPECLPISDKLFRSPSRLRHLVHLLKSALLAARSGHQNLSVMRTLLENKTDFQHRYQRILLDLLIPLAQSHEQYILDSGKIDYAMMIDRAIRYVQEGKYIAPWSDILIDEFQDLSAQRYALIKALRVQNPQIRLFCVGDDWQAIYRFAGSDIAYTSKFETWFGKARCVALRHTFRFNNRISDVASRFVLENPSQTRKCLIAGVQQTGPAVSVLDEKQGVAGVLREIVLKHGDQPEKTVLILARFRHLLLPASALQAWEQQFSGLHLRGVTVHAAKGQEADYVIVLGLNNGEFGFPSGKVSNLLQESLLPEAEDFSQAEERRLFYVALTRARKHVYLMYEPDHPSAFVLELLENGYAIEVQKDKDPQVGRILSSWCPGPLPMWKDLPWVSFKQRLKTTLCRLIGFDKSA